MPGTVRRISGAVILFVLLALAWLPAGAAANHDHRRVYVFVIDGLDPEAVGEAPFLSSMIAGGEGARTTFFENSRAVMFAETNPNHTAMITGAYGNKSGVNSNEYAVYREIEDDNLCPAPDAPRTPTPNATSGEDDGCLQVPTIFRTIDVRKYPRHLTTAMIMGKPKLARLFATERKGSYDADHIWAPCGDAPAPYCEDVPSQPITGYSASDDIPMDEVIRTTREGVMDTGRARIPDFTFVNFPQVDSAGHAFGRSSVQYTTAIRLVDREIERFVQSQKDLGIWGRTIMLVVSDHSMADTPNISKVRLADVFDAAGIPEDSYEIVGNAGSQAHVYLVDRSDPGRFALLKRMRAALLEVPNVAEALYRQRNPLDGGKANTVRSQRRSWRLWGKRAGDLLVTSVSGTGIYETSESSSLPFNFLEGGHGNSATADETFLVTGGHPAIRQRSTGKPAGNVDVAETVMKLVNRKPPRTSKGDFLRPAFIVKRLKKNWRLRAER